jgi:hypothetical protein
MIVAVVFLTGFVLGGITCMPLAIMLVQRKARRLSTQPTATCAHDHVRLTSHGRTTEGYKVYGVCLDCGEPYSQVIAKVLPVSGPFSTPDEQRKKDDDGIVSRAMSDVMAARGYRLTVQDRANHVFVREPDL